MTAAEKAQEAWGVETVLPELVPVLISRAERDVLLNLGMWLCRDKVTDGGSLLATLASRWDTAFLSGLRG